MISFKILTEDVRDELLDALILQIPSADVEYASDIFSSLLEDDECEYAISSSSGCLLIRIFDGEYQFAYPVALDDGADELAAILDIRAYAVKEEIPLVITDLPRDALGEVASVFRHMNVDATDPDGECFTLRVISELSLFGGDVEMEYGRILLNRISPEDDVAYATLSKDRETNAFWGYDYSLDEPNPADSYFRESAESELARGVALALAIRVDGEFAGEATMYAPDLVGGCECAVRLLPAFRKKGYATEALHAMKSLAEKMGLLCLYATVDKNNAPSIALCSGFFDDTTEQEKLIKFSTNL